MFTIGSISIDVTVCKTMPSDYNDRDVYVLQPDTRQFLIHAGQFEEIPVLTAPPTSGEAHFDTLDLEVHIEFTPPEEYDPSPPGISLPPGKLYEPARIETVDVYVSNGKKRVDVTRILGYRLEAHDEGDLDRIIEEAL